MARGVGTVETRFLTFGSADEPFVTAGGQSLPGVTIAYETYGRLNADRSNAILLFHALSGSQHAAGTNEVVPGTDHRWTEEMHTGWWDGFIGSGRALDTDKYFIICANYLGSCYGSTGPCSINPATGKPCKLHRCPLCKKLHPKGMMQADHTIPVIPLSGFDSWDGVISRLYCEMDGFQPICKPCHK